jgi:hypothetical protein
MQGEALCSCISQSITIKSEFTKNAPCNNEGLNIRQEFLPDLTRIMNETKMILW